MKKATLVAPGPGDEKEATQEDVAAKPQVRLHRETTVRFGDGEHMYKQGRLSLARGPVSVQRARG
eukprot:1157267-Pelagomonas_calceolata.AAC.2